MAKDIKEIERIWILPEMPPEELTIHKIPHLISYIFSEKEGEMRVVSRYLPEEDDSLNNLPFIKKDGEKQVVGRFFLTVKSRGDMVRDEWEDKNLPEWAYKILAAQAVCGILKTRHFIKYNNYTLEVDEYSTRFFGVKRVSNDIKGKVRLECEFASEEEANRFKLPEWAKGAVEVTFRRDFKNSIIASEGWPKE